jgi:signal peptide peptidase-like protein 2B
MFPSYLSVLYIFLDIFFVFITPLFLDGESVMITVAKGGNSNGSTADDFCFKYPEDRECTGIDFLPMLLSIPRINDWRGGSALLGLGDIICKLVS